MILRPDLHLHTTFSDGLTPPENLGAEALKANVNLIAITDHDTVDGIARYRKQEGVTLIKGIEFSASLLGGEVHVLGYGVDTASPAFGGMLKALCEEREERVRLMIKRLAACGIALDHMPPPTTAMGRMHVARGIVMSGYAQTVREAFLKYLDKGKIAYVPRIERTPRDMIRLLRENGAVPVIAHPGQIKADVNTLGALLNTWRDAGLEGLEVYHPSNGPFALYERLSRKWGLLVTGGSDCHGDESHGPIGAMLAYWTNANEDAHALLQKLSMRMEEEGS